MKTDKLKFKFQTVTCISGSYLQVRVSGIIRLNETLSIYLTHTLAELDILYAGGYRDTLV